MLKAGPGIAVIMMILLAPALAACSDPVRETPAVAEAATADVFVVEEIIAPEYRIVAAIMTNRDVGDARARIGGKLTRLLVREGDTVRRGDLVAVIVDDRIEAEVRAAAAAVTAARANAERARQDVERAERLFAAQAIARAAIEAARAEAAGADAQLRAAQANAAAAEAVRDQGQVRAPADGRVTRAPIPQGAVVLPGDVVVAISTGAQVLRIELPESDGHNLRQGEQLRLLADGDGVVPRYATIRQVYPAVMRGRITADLDAPDLADGFIGARVRVAVPVGERPAVIIPESYIVTRFGADYVRLHRAGGAVIEAPVQRGAPAPSDAMPNGIEILSGLRPGDEILPAESGA